MKCIKCLMREVSEQLGLPKGPKYVVSEGEVLDQTMTSVRFS